VSEAAPFLDTLASRLRAEGDFGGWRLAAVDVDYIDRVRGVCVRFQRGPETGTLQLRQRLLRDTEHASSRWFQAYRFGVPDELIDPVLRTLREVEAESDPRTLWGQEPILRRHADVFLTPKCNQRCVFCDLDPRDTDKYIGDPERVRDVIRTSYDAGGRYFMFAGREATMDPELPAYIAFARACGYEYVRLVSNATYLEDPARVAALRDAGLSHLLVSLHATEPKLSDRITGRLGDFRRTVRGIENVVAAGVRLELSHVVHSWNHELVPGFVRFAAQWPISQLWIAFVSPLYDGWTRAREIMPRIADASPYIQEAFEVSAEAGIDAQMPDMCSVPFCFMPKHLDFFEEWRSMGTSSVHPDKTKVPECDACDLRAACSGVWRRYLELYGEAEFDGRAVKLPVVA
jgi:hypothetical protein